MKSFTYFIAIGMLFAINSCGNNESNNEGELGLEREKLELEKEKLKLEQEKIRNQANENQEKPDNKPVSSSNLYSGDSDGSEIKGTLTFNPDKTVSGSYYFVTSPSSVYKIEGTNYRDGEIEVNITFRGRDFRSGTMTKSLTASYVIWEGDLWGNQERTYLTMKRPR
ncbi:MAG: hypothetical protein RL365_1049 [Bacteroidota bacterium]|jgi:hypothetical protein